MLTDVAGSFDRIDADLIELRTALGGRSDVILAADERPIGIDAAAFILQEWAGDTLLEVMPGNPRNRRLRAAWLRIDQVTIAPRLGGVEQSAGFELRNSGSK